MVPSQMRAVTLDVWHTLVQLSPAAEDLYLEQQVAALAGVVAASPRLPAAELEGPAASPHEAARDAFEAASRLGARGAPVARLAVDAARRAGRVANAARWIEAIERLVEAQPFEAVPGVASALEGLADRGYRTAVVSNLVGETGPCMRRILDRLGLARYIESWAFSEELPWAKPAPEIFWQALAPLETAPSDAIHIGDLASDVLGARAAGFRCAVQFLGARDYGKEYARLCGAHVAIDPPPEAMLEHWSGLPRLLDRVFGPEAAPPGPPTGASGPTARGSSGRT